MAVIRALIDTSVWLDVAQDQRQSALLFAVERMVESGQLELLVPTVVLQEFERNRDRVAAESSKSLAGHFAQVRGAIGRSGMEDGRRRELLRQLEDVSHRVPLIGGAATELLERVWRLLSGAKPISLSDEVMRSAADRALRRIAPCHHDKNSIADAVILEVYAEAVRGAPPRERFAFVTHNKKDFSLAAGNARMPHADIACLFSKIRSMYFVSLSDLLHRIDKALISELLMEQAWVVEPRGLSEILDAHEMLSEQIWYSRHMLRDQAIRSGKIRLVSRAQWELGDRGNGVEIVDDIWKSAKRAAKEVRRRLGKDAVGPWTDFEWGMINGKLSAIRWMLGDDWDMLDT